MTIGVTMNGKHCLRDLGMYLAEASIAPPEVRTNYVSVPGRDGALDLSTALDGEIHYNDRVVSLTFVSTARLSGLSWSEFYARLLELFHGRETELSFDGDEDYYYTGRGSVSGFTQDGVKWSVQMKFTCTTYRLKRAETVVTAELTTQDVEVVLRNARMPVLPTISVSAETLLTIGSGSYTLSAGEHQLLALRLTQGEQRILAHVTDGTGKLTITYREGML